MERTIDNINNIYEENLDEEQINLMQEVKEALQIGRSFDIKERNIEIGGRDASLFFVDGLVNGSLMPVVMSYLLNVTEKNMKGVQSGKDFIKHNLPYLNCMEEMRIDMVAKNVFAGLLAVVIDGIKETIIIDIRSYPSRGIEEPSKEKSLRGAKDGFSESFMTNIALIRRRIRDANLIIEAQVVGKKSKSDVAIAYMRNEANQKIVDKISKMLNEIDVNALTVGDQTIVERLLYLKEKDNMRAKIGWLNPFPKVRYTQRPDVVAAHIVEGKIAIIVDNSPTVVMLPIGIFDFIQDVDDYYFPAITGNYFRLLRLLNFIVILLITPIYVMIVEGNLPIHESLKFFVPTENFAIPIFWQFILLEFAIDALKLASLNTPDELGMSLSVIGALILGQFSVESGWFIPQTILCMAVVALASFTQKSIELGYGIKFIRILLLICTQIGGMLGQLVSKYLGGNYASIGAISLFIIAIIASFIIVARTKTLAGTPYLYPMIPFDKEAMRHLVFRTKS